jgi:hypothetical protein
MKIGVFLAIAAAIAIIYGVAFILAPDYVLITYGMTPNTALNLMARYFGLTLIGIGLVTWLVRESSDVKAVRGTRTAYRIGCARCYWVTRFDLGNCERHHEWNGLVSSADLRNFARGIPVLSVC